MVDKNIYFESLIFVALVNFPANELLHKNFLMIYKFYMNFFPKQFSYYIFIFFKFHPILGILIAIQNIIEGKFSIGLKYSKCFTVSYVSVANFSLFTFVGSKIF